MKQLRLLHLSDLHLCKNFRSFRPYVFDDTVLEAVAKWAYYYKENIDAIIITGDIAESGFIEDLLFAKDFIDSASAYPSRVPWINIEGRPTLQSCNKPIFLMPGNHDRYKKPLVPIHGGAKFGEIFINYWEDEINEYKYIRRCFLPNSDNPLLAILFTDFSLEKFSDGIIHQGGPWGQGRVYEERLSELIDNTKKLINLEYPIAVIWVIHFAPLYERYFKLRRNLWLLNSERLISKADEFGIRHIFCGHVHESRYYKVGVNQDVKIYCAGTSTILSGPPYMHYRVIEIDNGLVSSIRNINLVWDPVKKNFQVEKSFLQV